VNILFKCWLVIPSSFAMQQVSAPARNKFSACAFLIGRIVIGAPRPRLGGVPSVSIVIPLFVYVAPSLGLGKWLKQPSCESRQPTPPLPTLPLAVIDGRA
jgi:hypothetical protein